MLTIVPIRYYAICVDDKNKPEAIQDKNWVKVNNIYTIDFFSRDVVSGELSLALKEIKPDKPYEVYKGSRFRLIPFSPN